MAKLLRVFILLIAAFGFSAPLISNCAFAAEAADAEALKKAEAYLNSVTTLKSRFVQVNPDGKNVDGDLYISRPGRMRLVYDPPTPMLMVADGKFLIYVDTQMNDASHLDLNETPAGLLLKENLSFSDPSVKLLGVERGAGKLEITVAMAKDPAAGKLTLVFSEAPFELRQWRVVDAQHKEVVVTLENAQKGVALDRALFRYDARAARNKEN
ncbi:MAG: outer membrane lipoprotein carrier protein LolA [Rhodospirillaceae bacterium]